MIVDFKTYWKDFGYSKFGLCIRNFNTIYIPIPKNASSNITDSLLNYNWCHDNFHDNNQLTNLTSIIVLRDPIDRWISGINQYFHLYHPTITTLTQDLFEVIANKIVLDDHTEKQSYFCNGIDLSKTVFFKFRPNLELDLNSYFVDQKITFMANKFTNSLSKIEQQLQQNLNNKITSRLQSVYECDYELISKIKFYNQP